MNFGKQPESDKPATKSAYAGYMQSPVPAKTETTDDLLPSEETTTQDANLFDHLDYLSNLYRQTMHIRDLDQLEDLRNNDDSKYTLSFIDAAAESRA